MKNRDDLRKLTELHRESVPTWYRMNKEPEVVDGEVRSVYRHSVTNGTKSSSLQISLIILVLSLDTMDKNLSRLIESPRNMAKAQSAYFLKEGMGIQAKQ